jgi:hypothetical protein
MFIILAISKAYALYSKRKLEKKKRLERRSGRQLLRVVGVAEGYSCAASSGEQLHTIVPILFLQRTIHFALAWPWLSMRQ